MVQPDDSAVRLRAARAGSTAALGQLFESCHHYLLLVARQEMDPLLHAKGGASDLVQQTFLEAQRDFAQFSGQSEVELLAWLRQLLLHNIANFGRHYRTTAKREVEREITLGDASAVQPFMSSLAAPDASPSAQLAARERAAAVTQAIAHLPPDYRQVIELRYLEECSFEEIATVMRRSVNAVRKLWGRALDQLQTALEDSS